MSDDVWLAPVTTLPRSRNASEMETAKASLTREFSKDTFRWWADDTPEDVHGPHEFQGFQLSSEHFLVVFEKGATLGNECVATLFDYSKSAVLIFSISPARRGARALDMAVHRGSLNAGLTYDTLVAHPGFDFPRGSSIILEQAELCRQLWRFGPSGTANPQVEGWPEFQHIRKLATRGYAFSEDLMALSWRGSSRDKSGVLFLHERCSDCLLLSVEAEADPGDQHWTIEKPSGQIRR